MASSNSVKKPHYDILLVGKTGVGKSATGNSILGKKTFQTSASAGSCTARVFASFSTRSDYSLKVIDGPGLSETALDKAAAAKKLTTDMTEAMKQCTEGFHAILVVYKFSQRYTQEERDALDVMKTMFGNDVFKTFGICIMTHGDLYRGAMEDDDTPEMGPEEWCKSQPTMFQEFIEECDSRIVLFDNRAKSAEEKDAQVKRLLRMVGDLPSFGKRYTNDQFDEMNEERKKFIIQSNLPKLKAKFAKKCAALAQLLSEIGMEADDEKMYRIKGKAEAVLEEIEEKDKNTGVLDPIKDEIEKILNACKNKKAYADYTKEKLAESEKEKAAEIEQLTHKFEKEQQDLEDAKQMQSEEYENQQAKLTAELEQNKRDELARQKQEAEDKIKREYQAKLDAIEAEKKREEEQTRYEELQRKHQDELEQMAFEDEKKKIEWQHALEKMNTEFQFDLKNAQNKEDRERLQAEYELKIKLSKSKCTIS